MRTAVVVFTRDLRVYSHPALAAACGQPRSAAGRRRARWPGAARIMAGRPDRRPRRRARRPRGFYHQLLDAAPEAAWEDWRSQHDRWASDGGHLQAWKDGRTGYPIVDAGMRQLAREGWMHNRARLIVASFLTRDLYLDWRAGAEHFLDLLIDGDLASNQFNWQWVAGTGPSSRRNQVYNPLRQAERFDPDAQYVRRYVAELAAIDGPRVHRPWELPDDVRAQLDYPDPIVDHDQATERFLKARGKRWPSGAAGLGAAATAWRRETASRMNSCVRVSLERRRCLC